MVSGCKLWGLLGFPGFLPSPCQVAPRLIPWWTGHSGSSPQCQPGSALLHGPVDAQPICVELAPRPHSWGCPPSCVASNFQLQLASRLLLHPCWEPGKTAGRSCLTGVTHQGCLALPGMAFSGPLTTPASGSTSSLQPSASQGPPAPRGQLHSWLAASPDQGTRSPGRPEPRI